MTLLLQNALFFHTPKTGGQWVTAALGRAKLVVGTIGVVHALPDEVSASPEYVDRLHSFAFVRHPATWYQSMWSHQMDERWVGINDPDWIPHDSLDMWAEFTACKSDEFNEFVRNCIRRFPHGFVSQLFESYTKGCDYIGKQESIAKDLIRILGAVGETFDEQLICSTPAHNVRGQRQRHQRRHRYEASTLDRLLDNEARALTTFHYEIPEADSINDEGS